MTRPSPPPSSFPSHASSHLSPLAAVGVAGAHDVLNAGRDEQDELVAEQVHDPADLDGLEERLAALRYE